jgi:hypothetical protein
MMVTKKWNFQNSIFLASVPWLSNVKKKNFYSSFLKSDFDAYFYASLYYGNNNYVNLLLWG